MNKKEELFVRYAKNLEMIVGPNQQAILAVDASSGEKHPLTYPCYVCPLCDKLFLEEDVASSRVTLEHVPPGKLGGYKRLLVCKECNNSQGSNLESHLINEIKSEIRGTAPC